MTPGAEPRERLIVRSRRRVEFVEAAAIDWIDAAGNYVRLHLAGHTHRLRVALAELERTLDAKLFLRIHRSTIVNIERIVRLELDRGSGYTVVLRDGQTLPVGRRYRARLAPLLQGKL